MEKITLAGRVFWVQENGSIEHDLWTMAVIRKYGLDKLTLEDSEESGAFVSRVLQMVMDTGCLFQILASGLIPEGQPWSPEGAEEVTCFLKDISDPDEKMLMQHLVVSVLIGFFAAGLPLWTRSRKSSETPQEVAPIQDLSDGPNLSENGTT